VASPFPLLSFSYPCRLLFFFASSVLDFVQISGYFGVSASLPGGNTLLKREDRGQHFFFLNVLFGNPAVEADLSDVFPPKRAFFGGEIVIGSVLS